jgi:hypothetical protein
MGKINIKILGLGKTLQTITILSSNKEERIKKFNETKLTEFQKLPSLVVCPPTLGILILTSYKVLNNIKYKLDIGVMKF